MREAAPFGLIVTVMSAVVCVLTDSGTPEALRSPSAIGFDSAGTAGYDENGAYVGAGCEATGNEVIRLQNAFERQREVLIALMDGYRFAWDCGSSALPEKIKVVPAVVSTSYQMPPCRADLYDTVVYFDDIDDPVAGAVCVCREVLP